MKLRQTKGGPALWVPVGLALLGSALAWSGVSQAASCTIAPANPSITPGQSVSWSATYSGFSRAPGYRWTFQGGNPASSSAATRTVSYANAGSYTTSLRLARGSSVATCTTIVTVGSVDNQAPTTPANLKGTAVGTSANLSWAPSSDDVGVTGYRLERCTGTSCTNFAQIAAPAGTSYTDSGLAAGNSYRYRVRAADAAGNLSGYSGIANVVIPAGDTVAPTASLSTSVAGPYQPPQTVTLNVTVTDNVGVTRVEFYDGTTLKGTDTTAPYSYAWSFSSSNAGAHRWSAKAYDAAGNVGNANSLTLAVLAPVPNVSINSTSQDSVGQNLSVVQEQPKVANGSYSVLAINDLGMHCGDLDTRVASILPPFQVLLAQVIRKAGQPELNPAGVDLHYSAASNPNDPILGMGMPEGMKSDGSTYKTNFWDTVAKGTYDPFYPAYNPFEPSMTLTPLAGAPFNVGPDVGLPVPNVEDLYIGHDGLVNSNDEELTAVLHAMPGISNPYVANSPQLAQEHYGDKPFFVNFPFGYVANDVNWYEGAGVPFAAFDDFGRENAYPMVRVQAKNAQGSVLSTVDTVLPISGEASCTNCHSDPSDVQDSRTSAPTNALLGASLPVATSMDDPDSSMPLKVSVEYAADINILRLHDLKHGARYVDTSNKSTPCDIKTNGGNGGPTCLANKALVQEEPVVCQVCHYTPALDLAQLGPMAGPPGTLANGRNQLAHKSNSNVMHSHHGSLPGDLFPAIPPPQQLDDGSIANQAQRVAALEESCYQCHPGKSTQCLRGAMFNGGMLCSDCHGGMEQVGSDFSKNVSPSNPGAFVLAKDFYTNPNTPRVPWANEPGCGSCHTGDANSSLAGTAGSIVNKVDSNGVIDGIRLRQAFKTGDAKATPIVPGNKRFAEPVIPASFNGFANPGAGNPKLYRVSSGHGGVMCEGCHGATHAEWPNGNPNANDNVTAKQLQGHTGTISECSTCHVTSQLSASTQDGPHGMHLVNDSRFWREAHKDAAKQENSKPGRGTCGACHGADHLGTVLSRTPVARTWSVESSNRTVAAGQAVGCNHCHSLSKSFGG